MVVTTHRLALLRPTGPGAVASRGVAEAVPLSRVQRPELRRRLLPRPRVELIVELAGARADRTKLTCSVGSSCIGAHQRCIRQASDGKDGGTQEMPGGLLSAFAWSQAGAHACPRVENTMRERRTRLGDRGSDTDRGQPPTPLIAMHCSASASPIQDLADALERALSDGAWRSDDSAPSTSGAERRDQPSGAVRTGAATEAGVSGVLGRVAHDRMAMDGTLATALQDLNGLMRRAREMVELSERLRRTACVEPGHRASASELQAR